MKRFQTSLLIAILVLLFSSACRSTNESGTTSGQNKQPNSASSPAVPSRPSAANLEKIKVGHAIREISINDVTGQPTTIASRGDTSGELIVVYAPTCHVCHATIPRWIELYNQFFAPRNIPFIALSVQNQLETFKSIREMNIPFKVVLMPDVDLQFGYKVPDVPTTIALGPDGSVKGLWVGQLDSRQLAEVIQIFCPECKVEVNKS